MTTTRPTALLLTLTAGLVVFAACGEPFGLPEARYSNRVDTVTLYALHGTPPRTPSGYFMGLPISQPVLIQDASLGFDFVFDIDTAGHAVLLPTGAVKFGRASGIQISGLAFDSVKIAPDRDYELDSAVVVSTGSVALVQSRPATCTFGIAAFYYGKLEVLAVDDSARTMKFRILVDENCGHRGLEVGVPSR